MCFGLQQGQKKWVDISDQMSSYFSVLRKSLKWYRKVCFELLFGTSVVNAWVVYNDAAGSKLSMLNFKEKLARALSKTEKSQEKVQLLSVNYTHRKNRCTFRELEAMNTDDILTLLDEIPSDVESEEDISDDEDGENIYSNKSTTNQVQPFDINNIPIDFLDDNFIPENTVEE
nr:unnamed protein product [Callosobruchus chinensis]